MTRPWTGWTRAQRAGMKTTKQWAALARGGSRDAIETLAAYAGCPGGRESILRHMTEEEVAEQLDPLTAAYAREYGENHPTARRTGE